MSHATTVATLDVPAADPQFVGPNAVSWTWSDKYTNLLRTNIATGANTLVANCAELFDWSPDGTTAAYISWDGQRSALRQVANGRDTKLADLPRFPQIGCESLGCADAWMFKVAYSSDGSLIAVIENFGGPETTFRVWKRDGTLVLDGGAHTTATMAVWSGDDLYFRDTKGVEVWRGGTGVSSVLPGVAWIYPKASPAGSQIAFTVRDPSGLPHVKLLDTPSGVVRELSGGADRPAFLTSRYIWYEGIRLCTSADACPLAPVMPTGKAYIYDLQTGTSTASIITNVSDVWPHAG